MTLGLAIISFVFIEYMGFRTQGIKYLGNFFNFSSPINFFVGIIELISELARLISLPFRLFGNIFAGEIIVLLAITLQGIVFDWIKIPVPFPVPVMMFEMGVGVLQAGVFAMLTLFFVKQAITAHH
jgi:F-type H+-transporting ATPase subunit a